MLLFRILILSIFLYFSTYSLSRSDNTIFYPMPIHSDGQYITAQQLFLRDDGALWMYDVYGQLHLFDGQNMFTLGEKSDKTLPRRISFFEQKFWFIKENKIQSWSENSGFTSEAVLSQDFNFRTLNQEDGAFWGSDADRFFIYEPETQKVYTSEINNSNSSVIFDAIEITGAIQIDKRWLVSTSAGIFEFSLLTESFTPLLLGQYIDAIFYSQEKKQIILGAHNSVWITELKDESLEVIKKVPTELSLLSFAETTNNWWFGTEQGLYKWNINNEHLKYFKAVVRDDYSLEGNKIYALVADKNNGLWIATDNGVSYYSESTQLFPRVRYKEANSQLEINEITSILQSDNNEAWIGSFSGLYLLNSQSPQLPIDQIMSKPINAISSDDMNIWVATKSGVYQVDRKTKAITRPSSLKSVNHRNISHILKDSTGMLWFSSENGLYKFNTKTKQLINLGFSWVVEQKYLTHITHLYENKSGVISVGTNVGLYHYDNGALIFDYAYIRAGSIIDMSDTEYDNTWIVSNYGLQIRDKKGLREDVTLSAEYTTPHCVMPTSNGVWLSSSKGLTLYTHQGRIIKHFGSQIGLIDNELLPDLCSISTDGSMMFASKDGVIFTNELALLEYQIAKPKVVLGKINVDHRTVSYGADKELTSPLPYGSNISFLFGILPEFQNTSLSYQLVGGTDEEWQDFDGNSLIFDSLNSGKYTLRIKPRNNGQRSSNVTEFQFYVEVPWFFAPWFVVLVFSLLVFTVIGIYSWRSKEIKKSNERLKKSVEIKTQQLSNQGKVLVSSNRQLQKLLTVRQHVISEISEQAQLPIKDIQADLQKKGSLINLALANQCEYSLTLLKQLSHIEPLDLRQKNTRTNQVLSLLLRAVSKGWKEEFQTKDVDLELEDNSKSCSIYVQPLLIDAIFNNVLLSLLKRSECGEKVNIRIESDDVRVTIYFISVGQCIPEHELDELKRVDLTQAIEMFNQAVGLVSVKQLTVQNGGHFEIVKNTDKDNEILLSWPIALDILADKKLNESVDTKSNELKSVNQEWLISVYTVVEENYSNPAFGTRLVAKALFISERNFQRKFKQLTQRSFMEYLIEVKLEKACELLIAGNKVADAAFDSGFNDPSYFSKRFKRHYGLSPTQFVSENEE
ncbi:MULTISPECIES: helix-turn-helix domain-containing protein [Aliivibrio]|uniref:AraC family transcriptional regulator n=1 Tax=Aliivibrio finisterrensis TaxID=511998 RepID=A0A4Q5KUG2_9GAMM|nr:MULTISPECIES: helix-turn-helix domain-containing protein [Aliivibrio]MDD9178896.1 helix-turn-helix domain-containing protein [Aliivibrio sp. A6]RYU51743.1 AraC family transcriptional regulator [Aliivibrio finisterrensis]RYU53217.1 AraC family transcriptional regulator [Aliivibrio finisterrensis]RYU58675.1 AraC family transcriptional regulator [Aliivibrio finisterrensis]RYU64850.1 AraC family transcriptional regulator [Aliivibrio finisterrensis]